LTTRLLLVRHGQTAWNVEVRFQGQTDIPLDETGKRQAAALSQRLAKQQIAAIYASDLSRAWQTAGAIQSAIMMRNPCRLIAEPRFREMNFGDWQGMTYAEILEKDARAISEWQMDNLHKAPPGGETLLQLAERVQTALADIQATHPEETILIIGHGGSLQMLISQALGLPPSAYWQFHLSNASLSEICFYPDGAMLNLLNDTSHLGDSS